MRASVFCGVCKNERSMRYNKRQCQCCLQGIYEPEPIRQTLMMHKRIARAYLSKWPTDSDPIWVPLDEVLVNLSKARFDLLGMTPLQQKISPEEIAKYTFPLVMQSNAGWYIGTWYRPTPGTVEPGTRESEEYWSTRCEAASYLVSGNWTQRENP